MLFWNAAKQKKIRFFYGAVDQFSPLQIDDQHVPLAPIKKEWKLSMTIPLLFSHISLTDGEKGSTSFQIQDASDSMRSGLIMCENAFSCSEWFNDIFNNISALNFKRMKEFNNSIYPSKQVHISFLPLFLIIYYTHLKYKQSTSICFPLLLKLPFLYIIYWFQVF